MSDKETAPAKATKAGPSKEAPAKDTPKQAAGTSRKAGKLTVVNN